MTKEEIERALLRAVALKAKFEEQMETIIKLEGALRQDLLSHNISMDNEYRRKFGYKLMCEKCGDDKGVVQNIGKYFCKYHGKYFE